MDSIDVMQNGTSESRSALLVHGLSSSPDGWWRVRGWLEDADWDVSTVTLLGHGGRPPADDYSLDAYLADLHEQTTGGAPHDLVIGHSLGGSTSTVLAATDPTWTARLVLIDPVWYVPDDQLETVANDQFSELEHTEESLRAAKPHWHDGDIAAKLSALREVDPRAVDQTFRVASWDLRDAARRILTPTLVLGGDPAVYTMLEPSDAYDVAEDAADMRYEIVPGSAHSPHRDTPDAAHAALMAWLTR